VGIISEKDANYIKDLFSKELKDPVNILLFVDSKDKCAYCEETKNLLEELAKLSNDKIKITTYNINESQKEAKFLGIIGTPAIVIGGKKIYNAFYFGIPAGYEFSALLEDIIDASKNTTRLSDKTKKALQNLEKPVEIKVFVTPTCPYCPRAVRIAHQMAMSSDKVKSMMIEALEFSDLADKYEVMAVPKVVINDNVSFEGALPEDAFLEYVLSAVNSK